MLPIQVGNKRAPGRCFYTDLLTLSFVQIKHTLGQDGQNNSLSYRKIFIQK